MSGFPVNSPYPIITDFDGAPLEAGYVYIGAANQNPETAPIAAYWDSALTQPAAQPIRTIGGYYSRNGSPGLLFTSSDYSMTVRDKNHQLVYSLPNRVDNFDADSILYTPAGTGAVSISVQGKLRQYVSIFDFMTTAEIAAYEANNYSGAVTDVTTPIQNAINAAQNIYFPPGTGKLSAHLTGASNRRLYGPGVISTGVIYDANNRAAIYLDGVSKFTVDGLGFRSDQLAYTESCLYLKDTTTPCTDIVLMNCTMTNIKAMRSDQGGHEDGVGYPWNYYFTAANLHSKISVVNNRATQEVVGTDDQGYFVWLFWARDVVISNNITKNHFGLAYLSGGEPQNANWLASYQTSSDIVISNNSSESVNNEVVLIACKNATVSANVATCRVGAGEVLDAEGCDNVVFTGNTITGGQSLINTFFTANNVVFENNVLHATEYAGGAVGNGLYNGQLGSASPDVANSGRVVIRNNTIISDVGEAFLGVGWCKDMVIEGNKMTNCTIFSELGTNSLVVKDNNLDFTISPSFKPCIAVGRGNSAKWTAGTRSPRPKILVSGNTVEPNLAGGIIAIGIYLDACTQETVCNIEGNRLDVTTANSFVLETGGGVRRVITFKDNAIKNATPFVALAPIANDLLYWVNNVDVLSGQDALGAITGGTVTPLTVDAKAITQPGSIIWSTSQGSVAGWVYDLATTTWQILAADKEGTFNISLFDAAAAGNEATYSDRQGVYVKRGGWCHFRFLVAMAGKAGMTAGNVMFFRGFPFTAETVTGGYYIPCVVMQNGVTFTGTLAFNVASGQAYGYLFKSLSGAGSDSITVADFSGTSFICVSGSYKTA